MHHIPGVNPFKPMMNIIVDKQSSSSNYKILAQIAHDLCYIYKNDYNVNVMIKGGVEIIPDNTTVVNLTIDESTNFEELIRYLDQIPKTVKKIEEVDISDAQ